MAASIALAVSVTAPPGRITEALSTAEGLASFWTADSRAEPQPGSVTSFGFGGPQLQMRIDQLDPGHRIAWTCLNDFAMPPRRGEGTTVTWDLTHSGAGETVVLLQHENRPAAIGQAELGATAYTWARVLAALKGYAETGTPQPVLHPGPAPKGGLRCPRSCSSTEPASAPAWLTVSSRRRACRVVAGRVSRSAW